MLSVSGAKRSALFTAFLAAGLSAQTAAQDTTSAIRGTVFDAGGLTVAEASVSVGAQILPWAEARLMVAIGLEQARSGDLAEGDGEQAVRRAFAEARKAQSRAPQQSTPPK